MEGTSYFQFWTSSLNSALPVVTLLDEHAEGRSIVMLPLLLEYVPQTPITRVLLRSVSTNILHYLSRDPSQIPCRVYSNSVIPFRYRSTKNVSPPCILLTWYRERVKWIRPSTISTYLPWLHPGLTSLQLSFFRPPWIGR